MKMYKVNQSSVGKNPLFGLEGYKHGDIIKIYDLDEAIVKEPHKEKIFRSLYDQKESKTTPVGFTPNYITKTLIPVYKTDVREI